MKLYQISVIGFICLIISTFVSIAVGNIFLAILTLCFFIKIYQKEIKFDVYFKKQRSIK